eukprot:713865_1
MLFPIKTDDSPLSNTRSPTDLSPSATVVSKDISDEDSPWLANKSFAGAPLTSERAYLSDFEDSSSSSSSSSDHVWIPGMSREKLGDEVVTFEELGDEVVTLDEMVDSGSELEVRPRKRKRKRKKSRDKRKKKKKKRKLSKDASDSEKIRAIEKKHRKESDRVGTSLWTSSSSKRTWAKDTRGDPDNAVFGRLYRLDQPAFHRRRVLVGAHWPAELLRAVLMPKWTREPAVEGRRFRAVSRYFSAKNALAGRNRGLKRYRISENPKESEYLENKRKFIPMEDDAEFISESFADYLLRRTKEFNTLTQTSPNDIEMWCKFVDFQDECSLDQRKSTGPVLEKKIVILERALEFNSNSEILLLKDLNLF